MIRGVYFHIPFCTTLCSYCDFFRIRSSSDDVVREYMSSLTNHFHDFLLEDRDLSRVDTIFFGGGTPNFVPHGLYKELFSLFRQSFSNFLSMEVTMEMNPELVSTGFMENLREMGLNRVSLGVQTFDNKRLHILERGAKVEHNSAAVKIIKDAGFENFNLDLIMGIPEQKIKNQFEDIQQALELKPNHISFYNLMITPDHPLQQAMDSGKYFQMNEDEQAKVYCDVVDYLDKSGYQQYELSNFALPNFQCRHNLHYWKLNEYAAFGASASGYVGGKRYKNVPNVEKYIRLVNCKESPISESETPSQQQQFIEFIMLSLRLSEGINMDKYCNMCYNLGSSPKTGIIEKFVSQGLLERTKTNFRATCQGFFVLDKIISDICF